MPPSHGTDAVPFAKDGASKGHRAKVTDGLTAVANVFAPARPRRE